MVLRNYVYPMLMMRDVSRSFEEEFKLKAVFYLSEYFEDFLE